MQVLRGPIRPPTERPSDGQGFVHADLGEGEIALLAGDDPLQMDQIAEELRVALIAAN